MRFAHTAYEDHQGIELRFFGLQANGIQIADVVRRSIEALPDGARIGTERLDSGFRTMEVVDAAGAFLAEARTTQGEIALSNRRPEGTFSTETRTTLLYLAELTMRRLTERLHMTEFEFGRDLAMLFDIESSHRIG